MADDFKLTPPPDVPFETFTWKGRELRSPNVFAPHPQWLWASKEDEGPIEHIVLEHISLGKSWLPKDQPLGTMAWSACITWCGSDIGNQHCFSGQALTPAGALDAAVTQFLDAMTAWIEECRKAVQ